MLQIFSMNTLFPPVKIRLGSFQIFPKILLGDIRKSRYTTGINDTNGKFAAGVNYTGVKSAAGVKFAAGVNDSSGYLPLVSMTPVVSFPLVPTSLAQRHWRRTLSWEFFRELKIFFNMALMGYSGALEKLIHEKT